MQRRNFFGALTALVASPLIGKILPEEKKFVPDNKPCVFNKEMLANRLEQIKHLTAQEILDIYSKTGVLIWTNGPGSPVEFKPIQRVTKRDGKVITLVDARILNGTL